MCLCTLWLQGPQTIVPFPTKYQVLAPCGRACGGGTQYLLLLIGIKGRENIIKGLSGQHLNIDQYSITTSGTSDSKSCRMWIGNIQHQLWIIFAQIYGLCKIWSEFDEAPRSNYLFTEIWGNGKQIIWHHKLVISQKQNVEYSIKNLVLLLFFFFFYKTVIPIKIQ